MKSITDMRRSVVLILPTTLIILLLANVCFASGSDEKSPQQKAAESSRKATEKYNNGVKHMEKAREYDRGGDSTSAFNYRATSGAKAKTEYGKAVDDFKDAATLDPSMKEAFNNLGFCLRKLGKLDESLKAYDKALALDSSFARAREYRGELYLAMDDLKKAVGEYNFLKEMKSPLADTLSFSIGLYRLDHAGEQLEKQMKGISEDQQKGGD